MVRKSGKKSIKRGGYVDPVEYNSGAPFKKGGARKSRSRSKRGGAYSLKANTRFSNVLTGGSYESKPPSHNSGKRGGGRKSVKRRQTLTRRQKKSRKRESFLSTLNQMGGFIRDGSTQFFKVISGV